MDGEFEQSLFDVFDIYTFYEEIKNTQEYCPYKIQPGLTIIQQGGKIICRSNIAGNGKPQIQSHQTWSNRIRPE